MFKELFVEKVTKSQYITFLEQLLIDEFNFTKFNVKNFLKKNQVVFQRDMDMAIKWSDKITDQELRVIAKKLISYNKGR